MHLQYHMISDILVINLFLVIIVIISFYQILLVFIRPLVIVIYLFI